MQTGYEAPDIYTEMALRQAADAQEGFINFSSIRSVSGSADAAFSFGVRASRPASGAQGDRYFATDRQTLYYYTGTAWAVAVGFDSGTNATRAAIAPDATDNGAFFWATDTGKLWEVSGGAWVDRFVELDVTTAYQVANVTVVTTRKTGWSTASGTASRATFATFAGQTITNPPTQAEVQAIDDHVKILSQRLKALIDDLHATAGHGLLGT